jgi:hypothetical protein
VSSGGRRRARAAAGALVALAALAAPARAESPELLYMLHCQGCHLPDGSGSPGSVPDLRGSLARFLLVPGGRAYLVGVPGSAQAPLEDAELAALLNWMIRRFGPAGIAAEAAPLDAAEVARSRRPLADVAAVRASLLREIERQARARRARARSEP